MADGPTKKRHTTGLMKAVRAATQQVHDELVQCASIGPSGRRCELPLNHELMGQHLLDHFADDPAESWPC